MTKKLTKDPIIGKAEIMTIGGRIRHLRGKESRKSLCEKLNISIRSLINYENDLRTPNAGLVEKLCDIYNVTTDWLISGKSTDIINSIDLTSKKCTNEHQDDHLNKRSDPPISAGTNDWASALSPAAFKGLLDEYWNEKEARRGWLQIEVINRFPEFVKWLEQRPVPLNPAQIASLKKDEPTFPYGPPGDQPDD